MNLDDINITFRIKGKKGVFRWVNRVEGKNLVRPWNVTNGYYYSTITVGALKKNIEDGTFYDVKHRTDLPLKIRVYATHWTASTLKWSLWVPIFAFGYLFKAGAFVCNWAFELTNRLFNWVEDTTDKIRRY